MSDIPVSSTNKWSTGLCHCFSDIESCCLISWCPCVAFGQSSEIIDEGSTSCCGNGLIFCLLAYFTPFICLYSCLYRSRLRGKYRLKETPCADCCVHCWCLPCAMCQEYRELKNRGFDLCIGWEENVKKQNRGVGIAMTPVDAQEGMKR